MDYGLYFHLPYCRSRCRYCDFYTLPGYKEIPQACVEGLIMDFKAYAPKDEKGQAYRPQTVYFGGGTPGLLSPEQLATVLGAVNPLPGAEITLETNPDLAVPAQLVGWRAAGANRLSLGVQTADDASLKRLGRLHTAEQSAAALVNAVGAGFKNITGDIMMALPQYSRQEFDKTLSLLVNGGATHISAYLLKIEESTAFAKNVPDGMPSVEEAAEYYLYAVEELQAAGFARYEISNFAKAGFKGQHNLIYWNMGQWLGIGPSAHSSIGGKRFFFNNDVDALLRGRLLPQMEEPPTAEDYLMMRLRLDAGLDEGEYFKRTGRRLTNKQRQLFAQLEAAEYAMKTTEGWALTSQGMLVQMEILARLLD